MFGEPVVGWRGSGDPLAPVVVLLHGRGSHEAEVIGLVDHLPSGPAYVAVRGPVDLGGGYAWFENKGIGRPVASSLAATMGWFRSWLDVVAPDGRPVVLIGFSGGAAFAGGLLLDSPSRYAGTAVLCGTLPFDAGVPVAPGQLEGASVFVAQGAMDQVIPAELQDRTWKYLHGESGASVVSRRDPVGHELAAEAVVHLGEWLSSRTP
ncbi:alpha/beta hydrolase [Umezawaea endophytica]|uniref:Phospholipase/carboxylesterase/thioesterase domain-containing protein n=1 Tax=Umezawaea endophytica TaxID=1654476 RepID=A0A9X3AFM0_9PSEU|nr:hypothetical protein [Umezawaea endophytica]MCS7477360.1 hypothetical protein [Umezawaea endophytica]